MAQIEAVTPGTQIFEGFDRNENRRFFYYVTPSGERGGVLDRDGVCPGREDAVIIVNDKGVRFMGWKNKPAIYTF